MENINLIRKLAWSFHRTTKIDLDELMSEATLGYYEAVRLYDPNKGAKLSTFAWRFIQHQLLTFAERERRYSYRADMDREYNLMNPKDLNGENDDNIQYPIDRCVLFLLPEELVATQPESFDDFIVTLSQDCQKIVEIIFTAVDDAVFDGLPPKMARGKVMELLRKEGWTWPKIWDSMRQLKYALR